MANNSCGCGSISSGSATKAVTESPGWVERWKSTSLAKARTISLMIGFGRPCLSAVW
jgi:hypothetical protein